MTFKDALEHPETPATALMTIIVDIMGEEAVGYDIDVIVDTLQDVYKVKLPDHAEDKIQALQTIYTTDSFYHSIPAFLAVVDGLSGDGSDFENADMPHVADMAWAVMEAFLNFPPEDDPENLFSDDIKTLIRSVLDIEGFTRSPKVLQFAGKYIPTSGDTFMDDEMIYGAHYDINSDLIKDVEDYVQFKAKTILEIIDELPLRNRDKKAWTKLYRRSN